MKEKTRFKQRAEYLYPLSVIRSRHLPPRDVRKIKDNISLNTTIIRLVVAILLYLFAMGMMIIMGISTKWKQVEVYGLASVIAQIVAMFAYLTTIGLLIASSIVKNEKKAIILNRIASIVLFVGAFLQMAFGIFADAEKGFTTQQEALSASIIFLAVLLVIQPAYWFDAILLDFIAAFTTIGLSIFLNIQYGMKALHYYIAIAVLFPLFCYFIVTLLFYAECQHYKEALENERLTNKAYYDSLTHCKNRYSLKSFIKENQERWEENDINLLIVLFDIDNFKDYNDRFSHLGGDYCLKAIADAVRKAFPSPNLDFFRYGGEEFLLFFEIDNLGEAIHLTERLRMAVKELNMEAPSGAPDKMVTISIGATLLSNIHNFSFESQMDVVDKFLYKAKANGKDICCIDNRLIK